MKNYRNPLVAESVRIDLERRFCAGSDVMQDAELESVGIDSEEYDFSSDTGTFNFSWEETL